MVRLLQELSIDDEESEVTEQVCLCLQWGGTVSSAAAYYVVCHRRVFSTDATIAEVSAFVLALSQSVTAISHYSLCSYEKPTAFCECMTCLSVAVLPGSSAAAGLIIAYQGWKCGQHLLC